MTQDKEISQEAARAMLAALRHIMREWPDSFAAHHARAAVRFVERGA